MATTSRSARSTRSSGPRADLLTVTVRGGVSALAVALIGLAIAMIVAVGAWALAPHGSGSNPDDALRIAAGIWLLAHHVAIDLPTGTLALVPLGLMVIPASLLYGAGRQLGRAFSMLSWQEVVRAVIPFALTYGTVAAIVAGVTGDGSGRPHSWQAFIAGSLMATLCGSLGMLRVSNTLADVWRMVPFPVRQMLAAATAGLATMVGLSAGLVTLALAMGFPEALEMFQALKPDLLGGIILAVLGIAFVPNLVIWVTAYGTGVGFLLGAGSTISPRGVEYGPLPVFPPLAAIPPEGEPGAIALLALVVPLIAGGLTGFLVHRRLPMLSNNAVTAYAVGAGMLVGVGVGLLGWLSAGALADGTLSTVGPVAWQVGLVAGLEVGLVAAAVAWESRRRSWSGRSLQQSRRRLRSAMKAWSD